MTNELKPCPFCGSDDQVQDGEGWVMCNSCHAEVNWGNWNQRDPNPQHEFFESLAQLVFWGVAVGSALGLLILFN